VRLAVTFPELYQQVSPGIRRCLLNRFPYGLLYGQNDDMIAHLRQRPNYWLDRMPSK